MKKLTLVPLLFCLIIGIGAQQQITNLTYNQVSRSYPSQFIKYKDLIFFEASNDGTGNEIWYTDGTQANTSLLKDINPGNENGVMSTLQSNSCVLNGELYFIATNGTSKGEIWKTDGTSYGTVAITDFLDGRTIKLTTAGNHLFFLITENGLLQVWKSDGTKEGTVMVKNGLSIWNKPSFQGKCNDYFIFTFQPSGTNNSKVWRSDGTADGTFPLTGEIDGNGSGLGGTSYLTQYLEFNNKLYFVSRNQLHETDGTTENTKIVGNLWQARIDLVNYSDVIEMNNKLYFSFFKADNYKLSIWESDGTQAGTKEILSKQNSRYFMPSNLHKSSNSLIFCGPNTTGATSLMSLNPSNGVVSEIKKLADSPAAPFLFGFWNACRIEPITDNRLFIFINDQDKGWVSNLETNVTNNVSELDGVGNNTFVYNNTLYYSKQYQLFKYSSEATASKLVNFNDMSLFPNPASDYVLFGEPDKIELACIYDISGRLLLKETALNNGMNIMSLKSGTYIIECELKNGKKLLGKIVKH